jgi:hypothetical protein
MYALVLICCSFFYCAKFEHHDSRLIQNYKFCLITLTFEGLVKMERSGTMSKTSSSVTHNKASSNSATAVTTVCGPSNGKKGSKKSKSKTQCKTDDKFNVEDALAFINEKGPARKKADEGPQGSSFFLAAGISVVLISIFIAIFIIGSGDLLN